QAQKNPAPAGTRSSRSRLLRRFTLLFRHEPVLADSRPRANPRWGRDASPRSIAMAEEYGESGASFERRHCRTDPAILRRAEPDARIKSGYDDEYSTARWRSGAAPARARDPGPGRSPGASALRSPAGRRIAPDWDRPIRHRPPPAPQRASPPARSRSGASAPSA